MLAVLCPGQGAQQPGFLASWAELPAVADRLTELSDFAGLDVLDLGSASGADVVDTAVAQPLLVAVGAAVGSLLEPLPETCVVVGHSVGELTGAVLAGALDAAAAVSLAAVRGRAMAGAAALVGSGMTAVLGGDRADVDEAIRRAGCWVANVNSSRQVVAAGSTDSLAVLAATPPPGTRLTPLRVAGAFHSPLMQPAADVMAPAMRAVKFRDPRRPVISNADGLPVSTGDGLRERLIAQVTAPVRFDRCLDALGRLGVTATIEVAPGGVLTALVRRELPEVAAVALRTPDDLVDACRLLAAHAGPGEAWAQRWRLVVSPATGTFHRSATDGPSVRNRSGEEPVRTSGRLLEWLAEDGDPVSMGQPLARVLPIDADTDVEVPTIDLTATTGSGIAPATA